MKRSKTVPGLLWILFSFLFAGCACQSRKNGEQAQSNEPVEWIAFKAKKTAGARKKIVLVSGDEEYRSEEALPQLAKILAAHHGFDCTVLFAQDPAHPGIIDPNYTENIPGLAALGQADLLILFTRFRALPDEQMQHFQAYLQAGKPLIGIRTATHAFNFKDTIRQYYHWGNAYEEEGSPWDGGFGRLVLGERWHTHHGHHKHQSTRGIIAEGAAGHPIANGIADGDIWGPTDVYGVRLPLPGDAQPIVMGQVIDREGEYDESDPFYGLRPTDKAVATLNPDSKSPYNPNDPMMPIAWLKSYRLPGGNTGRAFTSTIGASTDLANEGVRRLLVNASYYLLDMAVPLKARADIVGSYRPSAYSFHDDEYWEQKHLKIVDFLKK